MKRDRPISARKFATAAEAELYNRMQESSRSAEAGLESLAQLRNQYWELYVGCEPRFQRVCRVLELSRS